MLDVPFAGECQCGAVRYRCTRPPYVSYTCHCLACQRLTSSAFATCIQVPAEALSVEGPLALQERIADSGNRIATAFCSACGSAIHSANQARPRLRSVYVGTLDHAQDVEVDAHIWTRRRLPWVLLPPGHRDFPGAADWSADYAADPSRLQG